MPDTTLAAAQALQERFDRLRSIYPEPAPEAVAEVVRSVLTTLSGDLTGTEAALLGEVAELGRTIASAKAEIAALRINDISVSHIPSATDELDAIVAHTAEATNAILETCETLDRVGGALESGQSALAGQLQDATTRIYEACGFQDITGQRISKVVATLKAIEAKVEQIVATFGGDPAPHTGEPKPESPPASGDDLLHGPQLPSGAMDQSDIDRLLASFE